MAITGLTRSVSLTAPSHGQRIDGLAQGEDRTLTRTITAVTSGQTISSASLAIGRHRTHGTALLTVTGTVTDTGESDQQGAATFALTPAQLRSLPPYERLAYEVTVTLSDAKVYAAETGWLSLLPELA